ncbi:MAG: DMT family transporter [Gammaproteobacteria bacterium]|nr:DMT family transporter [Gammaproteobacteria bacterium]
MTHALAPKLLLAALLAVAAELMFASMGATIKVLSEQLPSASVVFFRNLLGLALVLPWLLKSGTRSLGTDHPRLHILRGLAGLGAMYCFFHAIAHMPLAEAMLLKVSAPLFIPIIALLWLAEYVPNKVRWAIGVGFLGVALILRPGFAEVSPVALIALLGAVLAGLAKVTIRRLSATEPTTRIVFYFALIGTMVSALPLAWHWVTPPPTAWGLLVAVGVFATAGQLLMTRAYALAPAAQVGPFTYSSVIFATAYGWLFWGELMDLVTAVGATLVVIAGVMTVRTRRQPTQKEKPKPTSEAEPASSVIR